MQFLSFKFKGQQKKVWAQSQGSQLWWHVDGRIWMHDFKAAKSRPSHKKLDPTSTTLLAPLPGRVIKVLVSEGQQVQKNESLIILEAMKMEHSLKSSLNTQVAQINCRVGDQEQPGQELLRLRPPSTS